MSILRRSLRYSSVSTRTPLSDAAYRAAMRAGIDLAGRADIFEPYRYHPSAYLREFFDWTPYRGTADHPGQLEILNQYTLALRQKHEKERYERGELTLDQLEHWQPGMVIRDWLRVEAGHTVGKTKIAAGIVNHFYDCFVPSIIYSFAPSELQLKTLLWKEIKGDRLRDARLPGRVGVLSITDPANANHFALGRVANDAGGKGTERVHGQHNRYLLFVLDEAEGIPDFVFDAVQSMMGGGIGIVIMIANPKTRASRFYRERRSSRTANFRISCLYHPNVLAGVELVPNAVKRDYVESMIESGLNDRGMSILQAHDPDAFTFDLPYPVHVNGRRVPAGTIYRPDPEFVWRVMGIPPLAAADKTLISVARYEAAKARAPRPTSINTRLVQVGIDVARYGNDYGTVWVAHAGVAWRAAQLYHADTPQYAQRILTAVLPLARAGAKEITFRVDGTGGYGAGIIDLLKGALELRRAFQRVTVHEVQFGGSPFDGTAYADHITELYAQTNETLNGIALPAAPNELEVDLTEREAEFVNRAGVSLRKLEQKERYKKRYGHSPDDGDGFVLAVNPEHLFHREQRAQRSTSISAFG